MGKHSLVGDSATSYARYIGRVGALAVALGVGAAVATGQGMGIARAEDAPATNDGAAVGAPADPSKPSAPEPVDQHEKPSAGSDDPEPEEAKTKPADTEMDVESSGGLDDSVNDVGQSTDTDDVEDEDTGADADADVDHVADDEEAATSPEPQTAPDNPPAADNTARQSNSGTTTLLGNTHLAGRPDTDTGSAGGPTTNARVAMQSRSRFAPSAGANTPQLVTSGAGESMSVTMAQTSAAQPLAAAQGAPGKLVSIVTTVVGAFLSPFLSPGPGAPAEPPLLWAVLAFVRREISRTFFNGTPNAVADPVTTSEDTAKTFDVLGNDTDADEIEVASVTQPTNGEVTINTDGTLTYTPDANFAGTDTFTYTVSDTESQWHLHGFFGFFGGGHADTATVTVTVTGVNDVPVAANDPVTTLEDTPVNIAVLANDIDVDNNPLTPSVVSGPAHGSLTVNADKTYTYTPAADYSGPDSFTYKVNDGTLDSNVATVTITVTAVNDAPEFADIDDPAGGPWEIDSVDEFGVIRGHINVTDPDGADLTFRVGVAPDPSIGVIEVDEDTGDWTFTPTPAARLDAEETPGEDGAFFTIIADDGTATASTVVRAPLDATNAAPVFRLTGHQAFDPVQVGPDGTIYLIVATLEGPRSSTKVVVISPTSTRPTVIDLTGDTVRDLAFDPNTGKAYLTLWTLDPETNADTTTVMMITPGSTTATPFVFDGRPFVRGLVGADGTAYQTARIIDPETGVRTINLAVISPGGVLLTKELFGTQADPLVVGPDGAIYVQGTALDGGTPYYFVHKVTQQPDGTLGASDPFLIVGEPVGGVVFGPDGTAYQTTNRNNRAYVENISTEAILFDAAGVAREPVVWGPDGTAYLVTIRGGAGVKDIVTPFRTDGAGYDTLEVAGLPLGPIVFGEDGTGYLSLDGLGIGTIEEAGVQEVTGGLTFHSIQGDPVGPVIIGPDGHVYQISESETPAGFETYIKEIEPSGVQYFFDGEFEGVAFSADDEPIVTVEIDDPLTGPGTTVWLVDFEGGPTVGRTFDGPLPRGPAVVGPDGRVYQLMRGADGGTSVGIIAAGRTDVIALIGDPEGLVIEDGYVYVMTTTVEGATSTVWLLDAQSEPVAV